MRSVLVGLFAAACVVPAFAQTQPLNHLDCRWAENIQDMVCPEVPGGRSAAESIAPVPAAPPAPVSATKPGEPAKGSAEWNAECAKKFRSFDPETGMYKSYSGQMRPCV